MTGVYQKTTVSYKQLQKQNRRCQCNCKIVALSVFVIVLLAATSFFVATSVMFPLHASCSVKWTFEAECSEVSNRLVKQIKSWTGPDNCKSGQKCLYKLKNVTVEKITATHETPKKHYIDDLTFYFNQQDSVCHVKGYSRSQLWYALLDMGTNYCNLHNLVTGADLDKVKGYSETTSNSMCTQYSCANCEVY